MVYPLLPLFLTHVIGAGAMSLGVIEGVAEGANSVLKIVSGRISDRTGQPKKLVLAGYGLSSLVRPLDRVRDGVAAGARAALHGSPGQGPAVAPARRAARALRAGEDPRPGLRLPPRDGPRRRRHRTAGRDGLSVFPSRSVSLAFHVDAGSRADRHPPGPSSAGRAASRHDGPGSVASTGRVSDAALLQGDGGHHAVLARQRERRVHPACASAISAWRPSGFRCCGPRCTSSR